MVTASRSDYKYFILLRELNLKLRSIWFIFSFFAQKNSLTLLLGNIGEKCFSFSVK